MLCEGELVLRPPRTSFFTALSPRPPPTPLSFYRFLILGAGVGRRIARTGGASGFEGCQQVARPADVGRPLPNGRLPSTAYWLENGARRRTPAPASAALRTARYNKHTLSLKHTRAYIYKYNIHNSYYYTHIYTSDSNGTPTGPPSVTERHTNIHDTTRHDGCAARMYAV